MKTIRITGANSGIGKALAFLTAKNQPRLILLVRKESDIPIQPSPIRFTLSVLLPNIVEFFTLLIF